MKLNFNVRLKILLCSIYYTYVIAKLFLIKGIFSDSITSLHESEDMQKTCLFQKFQLIPILQAMRNSTCVQWRHQYQFFLGRGQTRENLRGKKVKK